MSKYRVFELAKEFQLDPKVALGVLKQHHFRAQNIFSPVSEPETAAIKEYVARNADKAKAKAAAAPKITDYSVADGRVNPPAPKKRKPAAAPVEKAETKPAPKAESAKKPEPQKQSPVKAETKAAPKAEPKKEVKKDEVLRAELPHYGLRIVSQAPSHRETSGSQESRPSSPGREGRRRASGGNRGAASASVQMPAQSRGGESRRGNGNGNGNGRGEHRRGERGEGRRSERRSESVARTVAAASAAATIATARSRSAAMRRRTVAAAASSQRRKSRSRVRRTSRCRSRSRSKTSRRR